MKSPGIRRTVDLLKALAHPARLRILSVLREGELCVCQVQSLLGLAASTVSEHLHELRREGLLEERKDGRWVYYRLAPDPGLEGILQGLWTRLAGERQVALDLAATRALRQVPAELTCARMKACARPPRA